MAEAQQSGKAGGFTRTVARKALTPLVHAAVTAGTAYLTRKAMQIWQERLRPAVEKRGGGRAAVRETLETAADKVGGPASEKITALADKVGGEHSGEQGSSSTGTGKSDSSREADRRRREQRRKQRRRALEQSGSS